ncbi:germination protein YpeB [Clostridium colicanis]|uniref:Sporulation protein YpeB n=1 Tax=Clostridium colicanis DSM 13634 TaxID=1121305 RepID=A0A151AP56_9CLOT|nr:germination protein YpeB [Clostridium colicanis]KYH29411.1 sporulation protein YpeB [Clostridium colicanis DSM 13634]
MNKKRIVYTIAVAFIVVFSTTFAILMTLERTDYRNYLQGEYSKNMYQLIDSVKNIKTDLAKSAVIGSKEQGLIAFGNISKYADAANDKLHSLPIPQEDLDGTSKFLSQVSDFAYSLARSAAQGKTLSSKDYDNIENLKNEADYLLIQLNEIQQDINEGKVKWGEVRKRVSLGLNKSETNLLSSKFKNIQNQVVQYPALIYDGPFSDNILEVKPKILQEKEITENNAKNIVKKLLGADKVESIIKREDGKTKIPSYSFNVALKGREEEDVVCEISKNGGKVVYLIDNRGVNEEKIDVEKAASIGKEYLKKIGYRNMEPTYTIKADNTVTISYVYHENGVAIYPDQIKLKIALDNGDILGIESQQYLISHVDKRDIPKPKISKEEARKKVGKNLKITSTSLAIVPTETDKEVLCYEFVGKCKDDDFIVYINAETGYEQNILQIIKTKDGELTI